MSIRRARAAVVLLTLGAAVGCLGFSAVPASGSLGYPILGQLQGASTPGGVFGEGIAVNDRNGEILVAGPTVVDVFERDPISGKYEYKEEWNGLNTPGECFCAGIRGIAVNNRTGEVYVAEPFGIEVFGEGGEYKTRVDGTVDGAFVSLDAVTVDQTNGDVYAVDNGTVDVFNSSLDSKTAITGEEIPEIPVPRERFSRNARVAVDGATGNVFIAATIYNSVFVYHHAPGSYNYEYVTTWKGAHTASEIFGERGSELALNGAVDEARGAVLVADAREAAPGPSGGAVDQFGAASVRDEAYRGHIEQVPQNSLGVPSGPFGRTGSVAVDQATGDIYVMDVVNNVVDVFGPGESLPTITAQVPTDVATTSATLRGLVDPEGVAVQSCEFEFGKTSSYGAALPCSPASIGAGTKSVGISTAAGELAVGSEYHYRIVATSAVGAEESADQRVITGPLVETGPATNVGQFAATVSATIEAGEVPTTYHFAYADTKDYDPRSSEPYSRGGVAPARDATLPIASGRSVVTTSIERLRPGTTYHYAVVASSAAGTFVGGPDRTFTTPEIPTPAVTTGIAEGVGVSSAILSGQIDPRGWATKYFFEYGASSGYGSTWPTVPVELGAQEGMQRVSVYVQNLLPGTVYHYRLVATNGGGTFYAPAMALTTGEYPTALIQEPAVLGARLLPQGESVSKGKARKITHKKRKVRRGGKKREVKKGP